MMINNKLSPDIKEFLERNPTKDFLRSAERFVNLLESDQIDKIEFYSLAHAALIDLYSTGFNLDSIEFKYSGINSGSKLNKLEDKNLGKISKLGKNAFYWEVYDPYDIEFNTEPNQSSLVDDFADIYGDLKIELTKIYNIGTDEAVEHALWSLKFSFNNRWGTRCIKALNALHFLIYDGKKGI
jgi:hypothetical protein